MWWNRKKKERPSEADASDAEALEIEDIRPHRNAYILMGLGGATITAFGIGATQGIVAPVFLALVLTICVHPLRIGLEKRGVPRGIATGAVIVAVIGLLAVFGYALLVAFGQFVTLLPEYKGEVQAWAGDVGAWLASIGIGTDSNVSALTDAVDPGAIVGAVSGFLGGVLGFTGLLVIIFTMLLLMAMDAGYEPTVLRLLRPRKPLLVTALTAYGHNVRRYMVVTTVLGIAQGLVNWLALAILGIPGAFLWGMLAFLCSFIPNIGYFIAIIPPLVFGGLVGGWPMVITIIIVYGVINGVIQSVIQPRVVGKAVSLSQTITFFSVLFWAVVLGPIGAILAIPATLLVRLMLVDSNPKLAWVGPMLGDVDEARVIMDDEDAARKAARKARKTSAPPPAESLG